MHADAVEKLRNGDDVLIRAGKDSDKTLIYQAMAQSKPGAIVLVISDSQDMMKDHVRAFHKMAPLIRVGGKTKRKWNQSSCFHVAE